MSSEALVIRDLNATQADQYRQEAAKNPSLLNFMRQAFQIQVEMTKGITKEEMQELFTEATDKDLKALYGRVKLVGEGRSMVLVDTKERNKYRKGLAMQRKRSDGKFNLLVVHAVQVKELDNTKLAGCGVTAVCIGAVAGLITLNPVIGSAAAAGAAALGGAKVGYDYYKEMPDVLCGYILDDLVKKQMLTINPNHEIEFSIE